MLVDPTVFVVDDDPDVRRSVGWLIESAGLPVRTYASAQDFLDAYDPEKPGCLVLDVRLRGMSGLDLQDSLRERQVPLPVILITAYGDFATAVRGLKGGALDILQKPFSDQILLERIWQAIRQDQDRRKARAEAQEVLSRYQDLTPRERDVLELLVDGKGAKEIASQLGLSLRTIEGYRAKILHKMEVESVVMLIRVVIKARETR